LVAFLNQYCRDSSKSLGRHIRIGGGLDFARGGYQGHQAVLLGHFGRLHRNHALVCLVYAEKNNSAENNCDTRANRHFMPRLHSLPLRSTTLRPLLQIAAILRSSMKSWVCDAARWPIRIRTARFYMYIRLSRPKCFAGYSARLCSSNTQQTPTPIVSLLTGREKCSRSGSSTGIRPTPYSTRAG